ncbi:MAG: beta-hydroxyacyl-[acyl-carrier-protein] dehydratase, partial [Actinomycetota bacterium]
MAIFPQPSDLLAHRPPFLFVDQITALDPGVSASGLWHLSGDEWFFSGHFPGRPTLPGVLMCEAIAQVGAIAVLS